MKNCIMGCYYDMLPATGIRWAVYGIAPCRTFVVSWYNIPEFSCTNLIGTHQIVLYESTYAIDIFIATKPICAAWNGGKAIQAIENQTATLALEVPGRNATQWTPDPAGDGKRYTPNGSPTWTFTWTDPANNVIGTYTATGDTASTNVTVCPTVQSVYHVKAVASSNCDSLTYIDSVIVRIGSGPTLTGLTATNPTGCGYHDGSITIASVPVNASYIVTYDFNNNPQPAITLAATPAGTLVLTGLGAGTYGNFVVSTLSGCLSNTIGPITLVDPTVTIPNTSKVDPSICGVGDGSLTLQGLLPNTSYMLSYTMNNIAQPPVSVTTDASGNYTLSNLYSGTYVLYVTYRGCSSNSVTIDIVDPPFTASYTYTIHLGCDADTVVFHNTSIGAFHFGWNFGDSTAQDTSNNPVHIYHHHQVYNATLYSTNYHCQDSMTQVLDLTHPLDAAFTISHDSICQRTSIDFVNSSIANPPVTYMWNFGDGTIDSAQSPPSHTYNYSGIYTIRLAVTDFLSCHDTAYHTLVVDTIPYAFIHPSDTAFCVGKKASFDATFPDRGSLGITWDFADGQLLYNQWPVTHSFDAPGEYDIKLSVDYSYCPDTYAIQKIIVKPYPNIYLGPDTTMCPNEGGLLLADHLNSGNPLAKWLWNDGSRQSSIHVTEPGEYSATVTIDGCSASDSVSVRKDCYIDIPNTFTPNGDGTNDYFLPRNLLSLGVTSFKLSIFNRWGQEIFKTTNTDGRGWDGKFNDTPQPEGVYVYVIDVTFRNGQSRHYQGNVTLLR
jgi:gliding motility-associated-like protein